ncbi:MAG: hypothetical protein JKY37_12745 [Nannocystaceae bacterium]|nr:hypothetical protein [Nannocystaceae bacterium]
MTNQHLNNLLFLLASGSLALACDVSDDDDGGSGQGTSATDDTAGDDSHGSSGDHGTTAGDDVQETGADSDGTAADTAADTAGDTAADTGSGDTGTGSGACFDFAKTAAGCDDAVDQTVEYDYCEGLLDYYANYGKECLTAVEEFYACLGTLDCRTFNADEGCDAEATVFTDACPIPDDTGTDETGTTGG